MIENMITSLSITFDIRNTAVENWAIEKGIWCCTCASMTEIIYKYPTIRINNFLYLFISVVVGPEGVAWAATRIDVKSFIS